MVINMKKKIIIIIVLLLVVAGIGGGIYYFTRDDSTSKYTLEEQRWMEENKNKSIDVYIPSDIASLTLSGNGLFFDFLNYVSKNTNVKVNPVAYQLGEQIDGDYSILYVENKEDNDIELYQDNYVVIGKEAGISTNITSLSGLKIGVLKTENDLITSTLGTNTYVPFDSKDLLLQALKTGNVDVIVGSKTLYLNDILTNNYHIKYHIFDITRYYVFRTKEDSVFKTILNKEYKNYAKEDYARDYNKRLLEVYTSTNNISEKDLTDMNSKTYTYGYVENGIYDNTAKKELSGINYYILKGFSGFANIELKYADEYKSLKDLNGALGNNIDLYFDNTYYNLEDKDKATITPVSSKLVYLTKNNSTIKFNNINYLVGKKVYVLNNSKIDKYLNENNIKTTTFESYKDLKNLKVDKNSILVMEMTNYEYYKTRSLKNYHIAYLSDLDINYGYAVANNNETFTKLINFYLEYVNINNIIKYDSTNSYEYDGMNIVLLIAVIILSIIIICQFFGKIRKIIIKLFSTRKKGLSKDEKMKYIDSLTSLKNRTYLNDNIEAWDNSEVYPQVIIVIDLNNVSYINDNYGHEEGDKVITEAANILIQTQLPNTEIIRTDGNEFLIYMVSYEEKKAASYIRKLKKEFAGISHGFGAAIGYSIINDAIKTIDDAVNEAVLDMKTNKELMMEEDK
jgi:diguanylate cyclase (GGDEF)-like protein